MRITVVGTTGSEKNTLAGRVAGALDLPHFELDAINWQPGWVSLNDPDQPEFIRRIEAAIGQPAWVMAGGYSNVRDQIWGRATHVIWLDYSRAVVMRRVTWRSVIRAIDRKELWPGTGNRENAAMWVTPEHPIRWAWDTYHRRQREFTARLADPRFSHAEIFRLTHPDQAEPLVADLSKARAQA